MAKKQTNDAKREDMKALVGAALNKGWTQQTLAAFFGYSSFSAFANGKSMGTNGLRLGLVGLPSFADSRAEVDARIGELMRMVATAEETLVTERDKRVETEEEYMAGHMGEYARKYPERHSYAKYAASWSNDWAITRAENALDSYRKWLAALQKAVK